jgi:hypothetical protein
MRTVRRLAFVFLFPLIVAAQSNSVTVTASNNVTLQPDEVVYGVVVTAPADRSLDDVVAAVASLGIGAANLVSVGAGNTIPSSAPPPGFAGPAQLVQWTFRLTAPLAKMKDTDAALTSLQQTIPQKNAGMALTFGLQNTDFSAQAVAGQTCDYSSLIADARSRAQKTAGAAGLGAGNIIGISAFSSPSSPDCSVSVKFALGLIFGSTTPDSIAITASRSMNVQPDLVSIYLIVISPPNAGYDDVQAALTNAGITGAVFSDMSRQTDSSRPPQPVLRWSYTMTAPLAGFSGGWTRLMDAARVMAANNPTFALAFNAAGLQVSEDRRKAQSCPQTDLVADARALAQRVAGAAGVAVGPILTMSDISTGIIGSVYSGILVSTIASRTGDFSAVLTGVPALSYVPPPTTSSCSLTVQFQMLRR